MPGSKSDYLEAKLLDHLFGREIYTPPQVFYVALYSVAPNDTAGSGVEFTGGGYVRCPVNNDLVNWPPATGTTTKVNGLYLAFPAAALPWGTAVAVGLFDAPTGGNMLIWADIAPISVGATDIVRIAPGGFTVTSD